METKFEFTFRDTEEMYRQLFDCLYSLRYRLYAVCFLAFALWMGYLWLRIQWFMYAVMGLVFLIGAVWYLNYTRMQARRVYRDRIQRLEGRQPEIRMLFGDDIRVEEDGPGNILSYDKIARIYLRKDLLVFVMEYQTSFFAPYDGMTKGTREELTAFLKDRCPNARFHR